MVNSPISPNPAGYEAQKTPITSIIRAIMAQIRQKTGRATGSFVLFTWSEVLLPLCERLLAVVMWSGRVTELVFVGLSVCVVRLASSGSTVRGDVVVINECGIVQQWYCWSMLGLLLIFVVFQWTDGAGNGSGPGEMRLFFQRIWAIGTAKRNRIV